MNKRRLLGLSLLILLLATVSFLRLSTIKENNFSSKRIYDRNGILLREIYSSEYGTAYKIRLKDLPDHFITTTIATEDKRFFRHLGVDPMAILRATVQNIKAKRIVSGGSTITQQLVRNMYHYPRSIPYKLLESLRAVCLELRFSKERILEEYINRIPYGNGAYGIEAASRLYLAKPAKDLTLAESAFLCAIPASNRAFDPYRNLDLTLKKQKRILKSMYLRGKIGQAEYGMAIKEAISLYPKERRFLAPHFCDWIIARFRENLPSEVKTTLDYNLQKKVEFIVSNHLKRLEDANVNNASLVVVDNLTRDILALVGSGDFFDKVHSGEVNGALALRQPGSTIKPFLYGLALESGLSASSVLPDIETSIKIEDGSFFTPRNYDRRYHGMTRLRTGLSCSYNVATVNLASCFGPDSLLSRLHQAGFKSLDKEARFYGPGLCLGNGEVRLIELVRAYAGLAAGGRLKDLRVLLDEPERDMGVIFNPCVSYILTDILSDNSAREPAFGEFSPLNLPFRCAAKTGTSKDFRDNWTIGYTPRFTVGVWVGNFSGRPMYSVSGISGAGPIFRDVMLTLEIKGNNYDFVPPDGLTRETVCSRSGRLPKRYCPESIEEIFIKGTEPQEVCDVHQLYKDLPGQSTDERVYEVYPPQYHDWAVNSGIEPPPFRRSKIVSSMGENKTSFFDIESPKDGQVYKIDPILRREYQSIPLKPRIDDSVASLEWTIDDKTITTKSFPFTVHWRLKEGRHNISFVALTRDGRSIKSRDITVTVLN